MTCVPSKTLLVVSHACVLQVNRAVYYELQAMGWIVHIVVPDAWHSNGKIKQAESAASGDPAIHPLPLQGSNPRKYHFSGLPALIAKLSPSIVFADVDPVSRLAIQLGRVCRKAGILFTCLSCENLPFDVRSVVHREGARAVFAGVIKQLMGSLSRPTVDHVFTISSDGTRVFRAAGFRSVSQIPLGFSTQLFFPSPDHRERIRHQLGVSGVVLAYFGRMVPEKGVHLLLESLRSITDLPWSLILDHFEVQEDPYIHQIARIADEPWIRDRIKFIKADHREVAQFMNAADVVVMPSQSTPKWKEQYGRVAPEAMACGCTVIAANSGTLPELIGDAGVLFPEGDTHALSHAIRNIITSPQLMKRLGDNAALRAREEFTILSQARKMNDIFLDLTSSDK